MVEPETPPLGKVERCICSTNALIEVGVNCVDVRVQPSRTVSSGASINPMCKKHRHAQKTQRKKIEVSTRPPGDPRDAAAADLPHGYGDR